MKLRRIQTMLTNIYVFIVEGVCHYDMCHIIKKFIEMQYFNLDKLNNRKMLFNFSRN